MVTLGEFGNHRTIESRGQSKESPHRAQAGKVIVDDETKDTEVNEEESDEESDIVVLRRSETQTSKPKYLDDYVLIAEEEGEMLLLCLNNEPQSLVEASELKEWIEACTDEIISIEKNGVWSLVDLPIGVKPVGLRWIFKIK